MIIDLMAYFAGLMMPLAFLLGLFSKWFPDLHFSWAEYIEKMGGRDPRRRHWRESFTLAVLTWIMLCILFLGFLYEKSPAFFILAVSLSVCIGGFTSLRWFQKRRIKREIEDMEWERLMLYTIVSKKIDSSIEAGEISFDPELVMKLEKITDLDNRIEHLKAK